ncbi:MAG TPA: rhomboid family intramembrane serine protease [Isosphaeraceae bacterium]|nr:rhomboid family intramembrane serine protease [Isosphaeraceae bacterium]
MGIYDREYYRDETRGSGFFSGAAPACKAIILINLGIFLLSLFSEDAQRFFEEHFAYGSLAILKHWQVYRLLTASFLHANSIFLIIVNLFCLWLAGREMEALHGTRDFVGFYLTAAVVSTLCATVADVLSTPGGHDYLVLGASGAVTAVVVLYTLYYPHRELPIVPVVRIEIWMALLIFLGITFVTLLRTPQHGANAAVVLAAAIMGGAGYAYLFKVQDLRWSRLLGLKKRRPRFRVATPEPRDKVSPISATQSRVSASAGSRSSGSVAYPDEQLDARLDEVLAKIAREGRAGLTEDDHRVLQEASQRARDRRSDRP